MGTPSRKACPISRANYRFPAKREQTSCEGGQNGSSAFKACTSVCLQCPGTTCALLPRGNASASVLVTRVELAQHTLLSHSSSPFPLGPEQPYSLKPGKSQGFRLWSELLSGSQEQTVQGGAVTKHRRRSGYSQHCIKKVNIISLFQKDKIHISVPDNNKVQIYLL